MNSLSHQYFHQEEMGTGSPQGVQMTPEKAEEAHLTRGTPELEQTEKGLNEKENDLEVRQGRGEVTELKWSSHCLPQHQSLNDGSKSWWYHLKTIWLFTRNDLKSIVFPETAFGIVSALSGPLLTTNKDPDILTILHRIPLVLLWTWINVLIFDVANQRLTTSIIEDSVNKPWRPLPSGRINPDHARRLLLAILPLIFVITLYLGGMEETVAMMVLTWMYNDLAGADEHYNVRNLINAFGFMCYSSGATAVASGFGEHTLTPETYVWIGIVGAIVFSTLSMQDMADQEGDRARDRGTLPLMHGDGFARWAIAIPIMFWSILCPAYWGLSLYWYAMPLTAGLIVVVRLVTLRSVTSDKITWRLWNVWITSIYSLPLLKFYLG